MESTQNLTEERRRVEGVLQRSPPTLERTNELAAAAREFYLHAIERRRKQEREQLVRLICIILGLAGVWYLWPK